MKKEKYYDLEMEIIHFDAEDIITESVGEEDGTGVGEGNYSGGEIPADGE